MRIYVFYIYSFIESVDIFLLDGIHQTNFSYKNTVKKNVGLYSTKKTICFKKNFSAKKHGQFAIWESFCKENYRYSIQNILGYFFFLISVNSSLNWSLDK